MRDIGGYIEFEHFNKPMLHQSAKKLNSGRNCLLALIEAQDIKEICIPLFLCDCIEDICKKHGVSVRHYHIGSDFLPIDLDPRKDEWIYLVNFYGLIQECKIREYKDQYDKVILDNAHAYFSMPPKAVDTIYTCRKFFGVPDGGILYTDCSINIAKRDESFQRMDFLLGRFERSAMEYYKMFQQNEEHFYNEPIKQMSAITENLLHSIDYDVVKERRTENYRYLYENLSELNQIKPQLIEGAYMYPFMISNGPEIRQKLINKGVFVPCFWPNVIDAAEKGSTEHTMAANILPLPIDQRYNTKDMHDIVQTIKQVLN